MAKSFASIILVLVLYISLPYAYPEFEKYEGMDCTGSLADILRDFVGTASQCKAKCAELDGCVGFVRLNSKGQCYFRGGTLNDPTPTPYGDDRDCYEVILTPRHDMIIVDENYDRIPSQNNLIGTMDVLDEIYVEFDIVIHSWPGNGTFYQIIDIEQTAVIFIYDPNEVYIYIHLPPKPRPVRSMKVRSNEMLNDHSAQALLHNYLTTLCTHCTLCIHP
eukprot:233818_1